MGIGFRYLSPSKKRKFNIVKIYIHNYFSNAIFNTIALNTTNRVYNIVDDIGDVICYYNNIKIHLVFNPEFNDYTDFNKFNGDFEKVEDFGVDGIHAGPKTNKTYAHNLFNYILKNHLNFLPKELNNSPKIL
jgi:hypothetical protein